MSWVYTARRYNFDLPRKIQGLISKFNEKITDDVNDDEGQELQTRSEGGIAQSFVKFCDSNLTHVDNSLTADIAASIASCPTYEPDGNYCKLIIDLDNPGFNADFSGFNHHCQTYGVGRMQYGIRYGYGDLSLETIFDGRTNYGLVPHHQDISINWTDFSLQFRFAPFDLATSAIHKQAVVSKREDTDTWYSFEVSPDGSAALNLAISNNLQMRIETPPDTIVATSYDTMTKDSPRYDVTITYDYLNQIPLLYINNYLFDTVLTTIPVDAAIPSQSSLDMQIGRYSELPGVPVTLPDLGETDPIRVFSRLFFGVIQQVKFWKRVLTPDEVANHYRNKVTISDVDFGNVAIPGSVFISTDVPPP